VLALSRRTTVRLLVVLAPLLALLRVLLVVRLGLTLAAGHGHVPDLDGYGGWRAGWSVDQTGADLSCRTSSIHTQA